MSPPRLSISFVGLDGHKIDLEMAFGWCFYLILSIGTQMVIRIDYGIPSVQEFFPLLSD